MKPQWRASRRFIVRVATIVLLGAFATSAVFSGTSFVQPAAAAAAPTGTLLKTVSIPACSGGGSVLTQVAGRMLSNQALTVFPVLLAVGCPSSNTISFVDPNSGTVKATVAI